MDSFAEKIDLPAMQPRNGCYALTQLYCNC